MRLDGRSRRELLLLAGAFLAVQLPFAGQALVVDDGNFVDQALQILEDPLAPYSFTIHLKQPESFFRYFANPPGLAYWLAGWIALLGRTEPVLHAACLPFSALAVLATYLLAREWTGRGLFPALLMLATPAFLVNSHTVMADVPASAFYTLAIVLFVRGLDEDREAWLAGSGVAAGAAALLKYTGLTVLPLMLLYALVRRKPRASTSSAATPFLIAGAMFAAWCLFSQFAYGQVHLLAAFSLQAEERGLVERSVQAAATLVGMGGATVFPPFLLAWTVRLSYSRGRAWGLGAALAAAAAFVAALPRYDVYILEYGLGNRVVFGLLFAAGVSTFVYVIACGAGAVRGLTGAGLPGERRDAARTLLLVTWLVGFLVIQGGILFATPKYLVPALAPLIVLLVGAPGRTREIFTDTSSWLKGTVLATTLSLALALSAVTATQARVHKHTVTETLPQLAGGQAVWFISHWTIRHYSEHAGHRYLGRELTPDATPSAGDLVFVVKDAEWHLPPRSVGLELAESRSSPATIRLHVANDLVRAGFWAHVMGVLPFVISTEPLSVVEIYRVTGIWAPGQRRRGEEPDAANKQP